MKKQIFNFTIFLMKEEVTKVEDCLKTVNGLNTSDIKSQYGLKGKIYYCDSNKRQPIWKPYLDEYASKKITIADNASNKALMIVRIKKRVMVIVFGYGRSLIKEECIERNFGLKVALNVINQNRMRSVDAATIEDMVVNTQRQASYSTSQDEFGLNITNDIMRGITGEPYEKQYGNHISGKDSLLVSVFMEFSELKDKLELYYNAFSSNRYKTIGFDWVDNVAEVKDGSLIEHLNAELAAALEKHQTDNLTIAPPETTDWSQVVGFCYSGIGKSTEVATNYKLDLDPEEYVQKLRPGSRIIEKTKKDKLHVMNADGTTFVISSIYNAVVFQTVYLGKNYILSSGAWYQIEDSFYNQVNNYIRTRISLSSISLPICKKGKKEGEYNLETANGNPDFCLFDKKLRSVHGGPRQIEACDIFTRNKQFIHIKNRGQSAQLSHLFSQGRVSAECFVSDESFRKQVSNLAKKEFGTAIFDYLKKPESNEFEVIYAIIDNKTGNLENRLPFFSKVNLMLATQDLERMHFKYSVCLIKRDAM